MLAHVGWSLGNYCNARCGHCYSWQVRKSAATLDAPAIHRVLDQLARAGVRTVNLGGNEPIFTHGPNPADSMLPTIIRAATERGLLVGVTTNGTTALILQRQDPDAFARVHEWHVSLDSPFADEHDRNRGGPYFHLASTALAMCRTRGVDRTIIYCAMSWNSSPAHVEALMRLARLHDADVRINTVKPTEPGIEPLALSAPGYYQFFREVARWSEPTVVGEPTLAAAWGLQAQGCPCGTTSLRINSITADGRLPVSPCVFLHELRVGDLLTEELDDLVARAPFQALRIRRKKIPAPCQSRACDRIEVCRGGCAARAALHGEGDGVNAPDNPGVAPELWRRLNRADPYCPVEAVRAGITEAGPLPCALEIPRDRVRVHDGYLCTFIGAPRPEPAWIDVARAHEDAPALRAVAVARPENTVPAAAWGA